MYIDKKSFEQYYFDFNDVRYGCGTIVKIYNEKTEQFNYCSNMIFKGYNYNNDKLYHFGSLYDKWDNYCMTQSELQVYIEQIKNANYLIEPQDNFKRIHPSNLDGIVAAWTWYILVMVFAIFVKGTGNIIIIWVIASYIFWTWRNKKMNGG